MLVSALNSHPNISCQHQDNDVKVSDGKVKGNAVKFLVKNEPGKIIYLKRNINDRVKSLEKMGRPSFTSKQYRHMQRHTIFLKGRKHIELSYEELTGNRNISQIPEKYANQICDYLEVKRHPLITSYDKN